MAANTQLVRMVHDQQARLESFIAKAEESIADWRRQIEALDGAVAALRGGGRKTTRRAAKGRNRGTWKPGSRGRPPKWYLEQQKAKGGKAAKKPAKAKPAKRKKTVSPKVLAALAKARDARAKKRAAAKTAG